ncbi:MAG: hypothetical protein R3E53_09315 [Myxococcota bacterium]
MSGRLRLSVVEQSPVRQGGRVPTRSARRSSSRSSASASATSVSGRGAPQSAGHREYEPRDPDRVIGAATSTIRVGSGGVMLPHYSAFKVAENFRMLETLLFLGRVDSVSAAHRAAIGDRPRAGLAGAAPRRACGPSRSTT